MMEHTIQSLVLNFINEQKNYHSIHGVWEDDARGLDPCDVIDEFLRKTIDEDTAGRIAAELNLPEWHDEEDFENAYDKINCLFGYEDEFDDMNYKN